MTDRCTFPRYNVHTPLLSEPDHGISIPREMLDEEICENIPWSEQYMWVQDEVLIFVEGANTHPAKLVKALLIDSYGQQLVDLSLDWLVGYNFYQRHLVRQRELQPKSIAFQCTMCARPNKGPGTGSRFKRES